MPTNKRIIMNKRLWLIALCVIAFALVFAASVFAVGQNVAYGEENDAIDAQCAQYTNSKSPNGLNLYTYVNDFKKATATAYHTIAELNAFGSFQNACVHKYSNPMNANVEVFGDDNIVKFVPKSLFEKETSKFYIGKSYGFYISTRSMLNSPQLISTVILIDVNTQTNGNNDYVIDCEIKPLVQIDYHFVESADSSAVAVKAKDESTSNSATGMQTFSLKNGITNAVVPSIRVFSKNNPSGREYFKRYMESEDFLISDISFGMNLIKNNSLNRGDSGYDVDNDYGYFIIGNDYKYSATVKTTDKDKYRKGVTQIGAETFQALLGAIPFFGDVISGAQTAISIAQGFERISAQLTYNTTNKNYYYEALATHNTRASQKAAYGMLLKSSAIAINSNDTLFFGSGDYARGIFNISHTDRPDGTVEYARANLNVCLKIAQKISQGYEVFDTFNGKIAFDINVPQAREVDAFCEHDYYMLDGGLQIFSFTPQYSGTYCFGFSNDNVEVYVNGAKLSPVNNELVADMKAGTKYTVTAKNIGNVPQYGKFVADIARTAETKQIPDSLLSYNGQYLAKFVPDSNDIYTINGGNNGLVEEVCKLTSDGSFKTVFAISDYTSAHKLDMFMKAGESYYIFLKKDVNTSSDTVLSVNRGSVTWGLGENDAFALKGGDNFRYARFTATESTLQDYIFLFNGNSSDDDIYSYRVLDENGNLMTWDSRAYGYLKVHSLQPGKTYFIGVKHTSDKSPTPNITAQELQYVWKVYKGNTLLKNDSNQYIELARNNTYRIELWLNGHTKVSGIKVSDDVFGNTALKVDEDKGEIQIGLDRIDKASFTVYPISDVDTTPANDAHLTVVPVFSLNEMTLNTAVDYNNKIKVSWDCIGRYRSLRYKINGVSHDGKNFSKTVDVGSAVKSCNLMDYLMQQGAVSDATFEIVSINIESGTVGAYIEQAIGKSITVSCMYSRKVTTGWIFKRTHYYIANELQLFNIRYDQSFDRNLDNDIMLSRTWVPIPELKCEINGNNYKIKNLRYYIGSGAPQPYNIGLVGINKKSIVNVVLENVSISGAEGQHFAPWYYVGGIAGINENYIYNCKVTGNITVHRAVSAVGGIVGRNKGTVKSSYFGLLGSARSTLYNNGDLGGIAGHNTGAVLSCYTENTDIRHYVVYSSCSVGGIVGYCSGGRINSSAVHNVYVTNANPNAMTDTNTAPKMGMIVGHIENGEILSVGMSESSYGYGGLTANTRRYCFNGGWPFYGYMTNTKVDEHVNQNGP